MIWHEQSPDLEQVNLFQNLTPETLGWIRHRTRLTTYAPGTAVVNVEQPGSIVYFILKGSIKVQLDEMHGASVILAILGPGDVVGEISLMDGIGRSANAITLDETTMLWMEGEVFQDCLHRLPLFNKNVLEHLCRRLRQSNERNLALSTLDLRGRLVRQMLEFASAYGQPEPDGSTTIPLRLTQSDMAALVGGSRERVNRTLRSAKLLGHLSIGPDSFVTIHDHVALARWAQLDNWTDTPRLQPRTTAQSAAAPQHKVRQRQNTRRFRWHRPTARNGDTCHIPAVAHVTA